MIQKKELETRKNEIKKLRGLKKQKK